jgi:uncharacterized membrane protein
MSWEKSGITSTFHDDKKVLTATFNTPDGANLAVQALQEAEKQGLLDVENTVTVSKNAKGKLEIPQATSEGGRKGARIGALAGGVVGLIFPPSILATSALGAAVGGMTGSLRGPHIDGFDAAEIKTMADELQRGQSMLVAIVDPDWQDDVHAVLEGMATRIGWAEMSAATAAAIAQQHDSNH